MGDLFNEDFRDFINALNLCKVEYMLVGGFAVGLHGYSRPTGDMDIWVKRTKENYLKLVRAFYHFGMPVFDMTEEKFLNNINSDVFSFGRSPICIDIITDLKGLEFDDAYAHVQTCTENELLIQLIDLNDLITAKKISGRYKDLDDAEKLSLL